jgi:hypothetical protein
MDEAADQGLIKFWRTPVFNLKLQQVPAFLIPRLSEMAAEVPDTELGRRIYYERVACLLTLTGIARDVNPATFRLTEPPGEAERHFGAVLGQAFHQGCSLADIVLATGVPADKLIAIGRRTIRRTGWLSRLEARNDET